MAGRKDQEGEGQGQVEGHDRVQYGKLGNFGVSLIGLSNARSGVTDATLTASRDTEPLWVSSPLYTKPVTLTEPTTRNQPLTTKALD